MTLQDEQLFGAPPGELDGVALSATYGPSGSVLVTLYGHTSMRREPMTLSVRADDKAKTSNIIGGLTPILMRSSGMTVSGFRRWMWAAHNRLGRDGYEVEIHRCGREPNY